MNSGKASPLDSGVDLGAFNGQTALEGLSVSDKLKHEICDGFARVLDNLPDTQLVGCDQNSQLQRPLKMNTRL